MRFTFATAFNTAALALVLGVGQADAASMLWFSVDGGAPVTCSDGAACDGSGVGDGVVAFNGALGGVFGVNVTTGLSKPTLTDTMDLNSVIVQTVAGAHTTITSTPWPRS